VVAIPAVIGFNIFKSMMKASVAKTELLGSTLLVYIQEEQDGDEDSRGETGNV
jgi:biopolymer transport protein ExbB/TolQ